MENQRKAETLGETARALAAQCRERADVHYLPAIDSTNSWLKAQHEAGPITKPVLVLTDLQTAGRGTRGRDWLQGGQDVALSCGMTVPSFQELDSRLSLAVGALVAETIECVSNLPARVKWPNDVLTRQVQNADSAHWRKVSGTLIETHIGDRLRLLVIGVGVNVNSTADDYPPSLAARLTTLRDAGGTKVARPIIASRLSLTLLNLIEAVTADSNKKASTNPEFERLVEQWFARDITAGTQYMLHRAGKDMRVVARHVDRHTGGLVCLDEQQREQLVTSYTELSAVDNAK